MPDASTSRESAEHLSLLSVLRDGPVRTLIAAEFLFSCGIFLQVTALGKQVFDITDKELYLGLLGLAEFLPAIPLVLVSGLIADRLNRRKVALFGLAGELACSIALMVYALSEPTRVWPLFVIAVLFGVFRSITTPAARALPPMVAPDGGLPRVIALNTAGWTAAIIVGPATSGLLYSIAPWVAYAAASGLIVIGMVTLALVRLRRAPTPPDKAERPTFAAAVAGLKFVRRTPILLAAISLDLFAVLFGGAVALLPAIAEKRLGVGDVAYGWLRASVGIGAALMAIVLAIRLLTRQVGRVLLIAVAVFGIGTVVLGSTHNYAVAFVALATLSAADMVSMFVRSTLVPLVTPDAMRGRVLAVENVFIGASNELGALESGLAAAAFGTAIAVVSGGVLTVVVAAAWWILFPALRKVDRFDDIAVE